MKIIKPALSAILIFISSYIYAEPVKVKVMKIKALESYNVIQYGARIEPINTFIHYSPLTGIIDRVYAREGDFVQQGQVILTIRRRNETDSYNPVRVTANAAGIVSNFKAVSQMEVGDKSELFNIADVSKYKTVLWISDKDIQSIKVGYKCYIKGNEKITGTIIKMAVLPDRTTGLFLTEVAFEKNDYLYLGQFVTMEIQVNHFNGIIVPQPYVIYKYGKPYLFIAEGNKAKIREIYLGNIYFSGVAVIGGVSVDELCITSWNLPLADNDDIVIEQDKKGEKKN